MADNQSNIEIYIFFDPLMDKLDKAFKDCQKFRREISDLKAQERLFQCTRISKTQMSLHLTDDALDELYKYHGFL